MAEKPQGAGSIWNPNSWHWEMKNYTELSKEIIKQKITEMEIKNQDYTIKNTNVKFTKAEAEVSIRKGKQYLVYEFELEVSFNAESDGDEIQGTYEVKQIASDDLNDMSVENAKSECKNKFADKVKAYVRKSLKQKYVNIFKNFAEDLHKIQGDPQKLEQDKLNREKALEEMNKAKFEKGLEKERLLEEQRARQKLMKEEFAKKSSQKE